MGGVQKPQYICPANLAVQKDLNNGTLTVTHHDGVLDGLWQNLKRRVETGSTDYPSNGQLILHKDELLKNEPKSLIYDLQDIRTRYNIAPGEIKKANPRGRRDLIDRTNLFGDSSVTDGLIIPQNIYDAAKCKQVK